jgi:peptidoglycan/xylan/chitin deacetylase (PgdA/CDA1 family)
VKPVVWPPFDRWITLGLMLPWRRLVRSAQPGIPILMYHGISGDPEDGISPYYRVCTSPRRFRQQMQLLRAGGWKVVPLAAALEGVAPQRSVVITFDDGFRDFATSAWPVLAEFGFGAAVFVATGMVGGEFKGRPCLSWDEIRGLSREGVRFGSHTVHHARLVELGWAEVREELADSRRRLEDELGEPVVDFCYPYRFPEGREFRRRFRDLLQECGYRSCLTTRLGRFRPGDSPLAVPRLPVSEVDDGRLLAAKLSGAYDWLAWPQRLVKAVRR